MNLEQLGQEVKTFIAESAKLTKEYKALESDLNKKVSEGLRGHVEARQELENKKQVINNTLYEKATQIDEKSEQVRENELKSIEDTSQSITADTLAELDLLAQLQLTNDDMSKYINKYKDTPLALRRLQEISQEKSLFSSQFPTDKKERLNVILGRMINHLSRFKQPNFNEYDVKLEMLFDGAISGIDEDVAAYRNL